MRLEDAELEFIEHFFRGNFRPELLFDEHTSNNLMMHPVVLRTFANAEIKTKLKYSQF